MVQTRISPRRTLRRVKHLRITDEPKGRCELEPYRESSFNSPSLTDANRPPASSKYRRQSYRTPLRLKRSLRSTQSLESSSTDFSRTRGISSGSEQLATGTNIPGIDVAFRTPTRPSCVKQIVSSLGDGTAITTFIMSSPASNRSADSNGFRSPFHRDPSPPLTPSDADSIWHERQHHVESHVEEIRKQISRLLSNESTPSELGESTQRQVFSVRTRSNSVASCPDTDSVVSIIYASSGDGNNELKDACRLQDQKIYRLSGDSYPILPGPLADESKMPGVRNRIRGNSSASMIAMLSPTSHLSQSSPITQSMTARLFISGSKVCRKMVSRIPIFNIFKRRSKEGLAPAQSRASSEASTLCTYIGPFSQRSDGRNHIINSSSHAESIWSVERDETVGASSLDHIRSEIEKKSAVQDSKGAGGIPNSVGYSIRTDATSGTDISGVCLEAKVSGCDRYLRLCAGNGDNSTRPPTAGYYEDPTDPNSYYRPAHTQSDIDNDVPTPPSGRCVRPSFFTTLDPNTLDVASWVPNMHGLDWQAGVVSRRTGLQGGSLTPLKHQNPSLTSIESISTGGSIGTVIRKPDLRITTRQPWHPESSSIITVPSPLRGLLSLDSATEYTPNIDSKKSPAEKAAIGAEGFSATPVSSPSSSIDFTQVRFLPDTIENAVPEKRCLDSPEHSAAEKDQPGRVGKSRHLEEVATKNTKLPKAKKKQSWLGELSLRVKGSFRDHRKRDSGYSTDRNQRCV